jgi:hypothetical protein
MKTSKMTDYHTPKAGGDLVLQEVWRAKDSLSAEYGHDLDKLFAQIRKREKRSGHPVVNFQKRKTARSKAG